jgi:ABC-type transport system substrate-binding protein
MVKHDLGIDLIFADLVDPETTSPFKDIRVRKAVSLAIDRQSICEKILFGTATPQGDVISPITLGYDPALKADPYDPEKAKALLKEAGYPKGIKTTMPVMQSYKLIGEAISANLAEAGIIAPIELYEVGAFYEGGWAPRKLRGLIPYAGWAAAEPYAANDLGAFYAKDAFHCYFTTPEIDKALQDANQSENDAEMQAWGRKLSKLIREAFITTFLWSSHKPYGMGPRVKSWDAPVGSTTGYETITLK